MFFKTEEVWVWVDGEEGRPWPHTRGEEVVTHRVRCGAGERLLAGAERPAWTRTEERNGEWMSISMPSSKVGGSWGRLPKMISIFPIQWGAKLWSTGEGGQSSGGKPSHVEQMPRTLEGPDKRKDWSAPAEVGNCDFTVMSVWFSLTMIKPGGEGKS